VSSKTDANHAAPSIWTCWVTTSEVQMRRTAQSQNVPAFIRHSEWEYNLFEVAGEAAVPLVWTTALDRNEILLMESGKGLPPATIA
jgi:hypothetical protein